MDLKEEEILGDRIGDHWYYRAKTAAMLRALRDVDADSAIDVGSGSGFFARQLLENTSLNTIDCVDTSYLADCEESSVTGTKILRRRRSLESATDGADLGVLMDVLEHVEDDVGLLRDTADRLRPGATVFITVPAFQMLWSGHDVFLGHERRYTLGQIEDVAERAGLAVDKGHYFFGLVFPAAVAQRLIDRLKGDQPGSKLAIYPDWLNSALASMASAEVPLQHLNRFAGLTAVVLAHKP